MYKHVKNPSSCVLKMCTFTATKINKNIHRRYIHKEGTVPPPQKGIFTSF
jgi:hypothetical protein